MALKTNYSKIFYEDYEKTQKKLDAVLEEITTIRKEHKEELKKLKKELTTNFKKEKEELKTTIETLTKQLKETNELNKKLEEENDRLKNQINKNSNNSSKPSSTNIVTPKKKTGANLYNYRKKTNRKPGGQKGHIGHTLSKDKIEELVKEDKVKVKVIYHETNNKNKKDIIKYRLGLDINVCVEKHIFKHNENTKETLPKEFYTDVMYDNKIKALSIELGIYNVVAYDRMSEFFNVISNGILNISNGTLVNFVNEFSNNSNKIIKEFENEVLNSKTMFTDETSGKYNKTKIYIRNCSNDNTVIYKSHKRKGHKAIEDQEILTKYTGGIVHDHDTTMYSYGTKHYECIIHLGRYLEEIIENVKEVKWPKEMKKMLFEANEERKKLIKKGGCHFTKEQEEEYIKKYDEIITLSREENKNIKSKFYKEKAIKLSNRLKKYKENHIYYIKDFSVPFDNNLSERELRIVKTKTKVSGGFRSEEGCKSYCDTISIINTAKKRNINPFKAIETIFNKEDIFAN